MPFGCQQLGSRTKSVWSARCFLSRDKKPLVSLNKAGYLFLISGGRGVGEPAIKYMGVSKNSGIPKSPILIGDFHLILGVLPLFLVQHPHPQRPFFFLFGINETQLDPRGWVWEPTVSPPERGDKERERDTNNPFIGSNLELLLMAEIWRAPPGMYETL